MIDSDLKFFSNIICLLKEFNIIQYVIYHKNSLKNEYYTRTNFNIFLQRIFYFSMKFDIVKCFLNEND